jgi:hypothetical protein
VVTYANTLPAVTCDVVEDPEGFSAELSVESDLAAGQVEAFSAAALAMGVAVTVDHGRKIRGLVSVDDQTLWVYVHAVGPGGYDPAVEASARHLLATLWDDIHRRAHAH